VTDPFGELVQHGTDRLDSVTWHRERCVEFAKQYDAQLVTAPETIPLQDLNGYGDDLGIVREYARDVQAFDVLIAEKWGGKLSSFRRRPALVVAANPNDEPPRPTG
jgi:hypothetical protein